MNKNSYTSAKVNIAFTATVLHRLLFPFVKTFFPVFTFLIKVKPVFSFENFK